jgi:hypothetical protein
MAQTAAPPASGTSWPTILANLYVSPRKAFQALLVRPRFWIPLAGFLVLSLAFTAVWLQNMDPRECMRAQIEQSGRADRMPPEQLESVVEAQVGMFPAFAWVSPLVLIPLGLIAVAGVYLFVFRFLFGGDVTFAQSAAVLAWSCLAVGLITTPLTLAVMGLKDDWNLDPRAALQANPSLFLDKATTPAPLFALAESLDLFSFWILGLMAVGFGVANRRRRPGRRPAWSACGRSTFWAR